MDRTDLSGLTAIDAATLIAAELSSSQHRSYRAEARLGLSSHASIDTYQTKAGAKKLLRTVLSTYQGSFSTDGLKIDVVSGLYGAVVSVVNTHR